MKVLYFGTACSSNTFELINLDYKDKASAAPQLFQNSLLVGLNNSNIDVDIRTFLPMAHFPISKRAIIPKKEEEIINGIRTQYLPAINLIGIKQLCYMINSMRELILWNWKNRGAKKRIVIVYGMYLPVSISLILLSKVVGSPVVAYVNDLPNLMFKYTKQRGIKRLLVPIYAKVSQYLYNKFDGYLVVSKYLNEVVNTKNKANDVIEAFVDINNSQNDSNSHKGKEKAIMYAGTIHRQFGIDKLLYAFKEIEDPELKLWIFGTGDMENEIIQEAKKDSRIVYFGMKPWNQILDYEKKASLLVNPRSSSDEYTKYSFPSKTLEYMLSGTPLLMTRLGGIDEEYFRYVYEVLDESIWGWKESIEKIFSLPQKVREEKAEAAKQFIVSNKNLEKQVGKVISLLENVLNSNNMN